MKIALDFLYILLAVGYSPVVIYRLIRYNRYRHGWPQRFGRVTRRSPGKKCIWLHAVSVGEVNAARTIVRQLISRFPQYEIVISTTTDTGFGRATSIFGEDHEVFYFPLDFSLIVARAFKRLRPSMCLLMEQEVWPNFTRTACKSGIPVIVVNGRISDVAFARYNKIRPIAGMIYRNVTLILAQTQEYARRFARIGCPRDRIIVTGSLKYDTAAITDRVAGSDELAGQLNLRSGRLWVAGATGPGEEAIVLDVYRNLKQQDRFADLRLAIVPRKPERFDEVAQLITQAGLALVRYSEVKNSDTPATHNEKAVILGDTMGDLRKFYSLATAIFVGRSLVTMGGSDMIEAAALGKCTTFGPHTSNFRQAVDALLADNGAVTVKDAQELLRTIRKCLAEPDFAQEIARNGREVIRKNQGATQKTVKQIAKFLTSVG